MISHAATPSARSADLTLFHAPNTRSSGTLMLLEELGVPFNLHVVNLKTGEHRRPDFLAVNPLGKVPAVRHGDALITEQVAIFMYLADLFPGAQLAPAFDDAQRGPYLRWLVIYGSCFEPAVTDLAMKREPGMQAMSPYGTFDLLFATIVAQLEAGPYLLGDRFTAADLLWGVGLGWTSRFKLIPDNPAVADYIERIGNRAAVAKTMAHDGALAAQQDAAAAASAPA